MCVLEKDNLRTSLIVYWKEESNLTFTPCDKENTTLFANFGYNNKLLLKEINLTCGPCDKFFVVVFMMI